MTTPAEDVKEIGGLAGAVMRAWKARRAMMSRPDRSLRVVESISLGGRKQVHLVCCGDQQFLVGTGGDAVQSIVPVAAHKHESVTA